MKVCQMSFRSNNNDKIQWQDKSDTNIRAGWLMTGLTIPPMKIFFRKKIHLKTSWIHLGPKSPIWDTFQAFQVYPATPGNCQVYPGVSRCIPKKIFPAEGRKNFFLTGLASPPLKFFSANSVYQNDFLKELLVKCVI